MTLEPLDGNPAPDGLEPLRQAFARVPEDGPGRFVGSGDCPEPDTVWAAVHSELRVSEIEAIVEHTASCAHCAEEWRLAREIGGRAEVDGAPSGTFQTTRTRAAQAEEDGGGQVISFRDRTRRVAVPLAGLAAAAALVLMVGRSGEQPVSKLRTQETVEITSEVAQGRVVDRQGLALSWTEIPGATYSVLVTDASLAVVGSADDLGEPRFFVPPESVAHLPSGAELYWQVEATLPDGTTERSRSFVVRLE